MERSADIEILDGSAVDVESALPPDPRRELSLDIPGIARYLCRTDRIVVIRGAATQQDTVMAFLVANALPAALWMRGEVVIHAAGVRFPGMRRAIGVAGVSGSGKSIVLSQLVAEGLEVVGDDTLCVRLEGAGVNISGLPSSCYIRRSLSGVDDERDLESIPPQQQLASAELAALLVLKLPRSSGEPCFQPLWGVNALELLLRNRHRPGVPRYLRNEGAMLSWMVRFVEQCKMVSWQRTEGRVRLDASEMEFLSGLALEMGSERRNDEGNTLEADN